MADPQLQSIVEKMVAAGEPEENIALVIQHYKPQQQAQPAQPSSPQKTVDPYTFAAKKIIGLVKDNPVTAGAIGGGLLAAPLTGGASIPAAMAAAGLGAAGGAGLGSIASAAMGNEGGPRTASDVAKTMVAEGAAGALGEGIGGGAAKILKSGGKLVYKTALRPSMGLQREFGDLAATGLREGLPVSEGGARRAGELVGESANTAKRLVSQAKQAGAAPVGVRDVAVNGGIKDVAQRAGLRAQSGLPDERLAIAGRIRGLASQNPGGIDIEQAQAMKGELQDLASRVYRAADRGNPVLDLGADTNAALARGLRAEVDKSAAAAGFPGVNQANARTQELIGVTRALEDANRRNVPGVGSLRSLLGDFVPSVSSRGGILLDRAGNVPFNDALKTALIAALGGQD